MVDDRLLHAPVLDQVVHEQAHHLELVDEGALLVGRTRAVRVAVEQQPEVVAALREDAERLVDVRPDRLRVDAPEPRVALGVDLASPGCGRRRQPREPARARAPHGSTSTDMSAALRRSRSTVRWT